MRKVAKWVLVVATVGLAALAVTRYRTANSEAERWNALTLERKKTIITRSLPSFQALLKRQAGWNIDVLSEAYYGGYKENYTDDLGLLVENGRLAGYCHAQFFFHGWESQPASAELRLSLKPWLIDKLPKTEFKLLVDQTRKEGSVRTRMGDVDWFSQMDNGDTRINLRVAYPSRWIEDIPQYDRGFVDQMRFEVVPKIGRFIYREILADEYTPLALQSPVFNPPSDTWKDPVGSVSGYFRTKDERLIPVEIATSATTGFPRQVSLRVRIGAFGGAPGQGATQDDMLKLLKPALAELTKKPPFERYQKGDLVIQFDPGSKASLWIDCPLDYPLEETHLDQMTLMQ